METTPTPKCPLSVAQFGCGFSTLSPDAARKLTKLTHWGFKTVSGLHSRLLSDSLIAGEPVEEFADVADGEQRGGVQVRQNLDQDLRREPEEEETKAFPQRSGRQQNFAACIFFYKRTLEMTIFNIT